MKYKKTRKLDDREKTLLKKTINDKTISSFAVNLLELIDEKDVSFDDLQEETGISKGSLSAYKRGETVPSALVINKLADYFAVSADYLLGRTTVKKPNFDHVEIEKTLGLSEKAIERLIEIRRFCFEIEDFEIINVINEILINPKSKYFFSVVGDYIYPKKYIDKIELISKLSEGSKLTDFMVKMDSVNQTNVVEVGNLTKIIARSKIAEINEILHSLSVDINGGEK